MTQQTLLAIVGVFIGIAIVVSGSAGSGNWLGDLLAVFGRVMSMVTTRYATATEVSMTLMLETVLAPVWAYLFFTEVPWINSILGGAVVLITILAYTLYLTKEDS
ncbi:hypothetical protein [Phaeobacter sp. C3_T13_0]|uniref:hypothetical protein n=1 Tax=Phaeobacter cretensis TaxID=3342641 RepID=UPI0039BD2171